MSDGDKPLFFGGLPPRTGAAVVEDSTPDATTSESENAAQWNVLAIVSFVGSFVISLVGVVCGFLALRQIRRTGERGRGLATTGVVLGFVGLAVGVAMIAVFMVGGAALVGSIAGVPPTHGSVQVAPTLSPAEEAAAKAAIASGGGAIPGHIVSGELCAAVKSYFAQSAGANSSTNVSSEALAALEQLAAVQSPYQGKYQAYLAMVKDPASVPKPDQVQQLSANFAKAVQVDITTCA